MIAVEVNGRHIEASEGEMLLNVLRREDIHVPTLCHVEGLTPTGACRLCVVEVEGMPGLVPSCAEGGVLGILPGVVGAVQATEDLTQQDWQTLRTIPSAPTHQLDIIDPAATNHPYRAYRILWLR